MATMIAVSKDPAPQFFTNAMSGARASNIDDIDFFAGPVE